MGRTPTKRDAEGAVLVRLTAEEYNQAYDEIITRRHSTFQEYLRNALLAPSNTRKMITMLENILKEVKLTETLSDRIKSFLKELKGIR